MHPLFVRVDELRALRSDLAAALERVDRLIEADAPAARLDEHVAGLRELPRTVAIETVLAGAEHALRPIEIWEALRAAGRDDPKMEVQVTTFDLWQRGRIGKIGRGLYVSVPDAARTAS